MQFDITPIIGAFFVLLSSMITSVVIPWIRKKATNEQQAEIRNWTQLAVQAAEMLYKGVGRGEDKLDFVLNFLSERGFKLNESELRVMVESAVKQLQNQDNWIEIEVEE